MIVTGCVPLAGRGLVARRGSLIALTDGMDTGPDLLLTALAAVADANGDGGALVRAGTRAAVERGGHPAWACVGVTFGEEVAVLVHGEAAALVSVDGSPEAELMASGSMIPVVRIFTGAFITVRLVIGPPAAPDPRLWLDAGTVFGGGVLLTIKHDKPQNLIPNDPYAPLAAPPRPSPEQAVENPVFHPSASVPAAPVAAVPVPADVAPGEVYPEDALPEPEFSEPEFPEPVLPTAAPLEEAAYPPGYEPTMLAWNSGRQVGAPAPFQQPAAFQQPAFFQEPAAPEVTPFPDGPFVNPAGPAADGQGGPETESWFRNQGQRSGPTTRMTQSDGAGSGWSERPIADLATVTLVQVGAVEPVLVDGAMCVRMHFNAPDAMACRECGVSMRDIPRDMRRQPRPPLGILLVDDGRGYPLDRDYVIGREPLLDGDVAVGRATPLPLSDPESSVSRLHLRVSLVGWQVQVRDLGSSNGSVLYRAGGPRKLAPVDAAVLDPGARVGVGRRTVQFLPYSTSPHSASPHGAIPTE